ncbi:MAG: (Fe-S)-binding protein [Desulfohalobium sp.]
MSADLQELAKLLRDIEEQLVSCMKCGMCQASCPLFAETGREADVARGKIALLENLAHEMIEDPKGVKDRLDKCLLCGSCAAACPSGVKVLDIFIKARAILTGYMGLSPAKKAIFRGMLQHPELFNGVIGVASKFQGLFTKPVNDMIGSSCARFMSPLIGDRHFQPLAKEPLHKKYGALDTKAGNSGIKVALYPGCLVDKIFPRVGDAVMKVLEHHGVGVYMPSKQACCGIPAISSGDKQTYDKLVRQNLEVFEKGEFDYLLTPCATCTSTIKKIWPVMAEDYEGALRNRVNILSDKTMDVNAFLVDILGITAVGDPNATAKTVTYHDPCHLKKSLGVAAQPRTLLRCNPGYQLKEMTEADRCCGMGGSFNIQHYDLSEQIGGHKRDSILATEAQVLATGCPACMMQISDLLSHSDAQVSIKHPVEIYAETLPE